MERANVAAADSGSESVLSFVFTDEHTSIQDVPEALYSNNTLFHRCMSCDVGFELPETEFGSMRSEAPACARNVVSLVLPFWILCVSHA